MNSKVLVITFLTLFSIALTYTAGLSPVSADEVKESDLRAQSDAEGEARDGDDEDVDSVWGALKFTGQKIEYGGVKAGQGLKKGGKATGRAFKKTGSSIKKFFVGD